MESVLEQQRAAHEEIERLEQAIVDQYMSQPKTQKERLENEHVVNRYLNKITEKSKQLYDLYEDKEGARKKEIDALATTSDSFGEFYERLRVIKDHHRKYPNELVEPPELQFIHQQQQKHNDGTEESELETLFSGEEGTGRFLDLNSLYTHYINLKNIKRVDYLAYLSKFDDFTESYPKETKMTADYRNYLTALQTYLEGFFARAKPLYNINDLREKIKEKFESDWKEKKVPGWEKKLGEEEEAQPQLFCIACQKQFSKQTVFDSHLTGKKHIKAQKQLLEQKGPNVDQADIERARQKALEEKEDKDKPIAWQEVLISSYIDVLSSYREDTKANVERKQALTDRERALEQEQDELEIVENDSDDDDEDKIYNPLKLPLGWDGKPIPYWLYKLHGLGVEYPCEICGDFVYMGRKAFDKHFQEWRHAHGMRALGIPNTRHFHEITQIDDAYALWNKLKKKGRADDFKADTLEEFEDAEGNVFNKKTYEDLKRQGIL
ncbi:Pre-mRNA-splicing factor sap61 [Umbelopsis nana]